jgi:DNA-binding beta-propeller fold protein YncE
VAALLAVVIAGFAAWSTAQATAVVNRAVKAVTTAQGMTALRSGPAGVPLLAPSLLHIYGLRTAALFLAMIVALGAGTFVLREAATARVIGTRQGYAGDNGPAIQAALNHPGGIAVSSSGEVYFADSNNHVIRRIDSRNNIATVAGNNGLGTGFSGDFGPATRAQLDTPEGVAMAPDGDLIVADSRNERVRRIDRQTGTIHTIAGSGASGYDGDEKPATEAALNSPGGVAASANGDIYIADTLNHRIRMIDHATGHIHTVAGVGVPGQPGGPVGDGGPAVEAYLNMPSDVAIGPTGDLYIADMHHQRVRRVDARTRIITTVAGNGRWGRSGDGGPAVQATLAGPAGIAVVPDIDNTVTIFIADFYNGLVRAVGPDGVIRSVSERSEATLSAPSRVAYEPRGGWLYVADSSNDRLVVFNIPRIAPSLVGARRTPAAPPRPRKAIG